MTKIDLKKSLSPCYRAAAKVALVEVPPITFITVQGSGDPNSSQDFIDAMAVLYGLAYTLKFSCKADGRDFTVMPLEGQWWSADDAHFAEASRDEWNWKMMIAVPDFIDGELFERACTTLERKKNPAGLSKAALETITDGLSAQFLYVGPYSGEAPFIAEMHRWVQEQGYRLRSRHREIYLGNPQRVAPEKLKTIIRHPVEKL
ncbi:GyrI-like domain-containing protein [Salinispira pacifica]